VRACRVCGGVSLGPVIDLGPMPLVNNLLDAAKDACPTWPLKVVFCRDCALAQLTESAPADEMFRDYRYFSSQSRTMVEHAGRLVQRFVTPGQRVVEIASNDGYLLRHAIERGATVLGVDPAENVVAHAVRSGVPTRCDYFGPAAAVAIRDEFGLADVMFANNVLAHVDEPHEIAAGIAAVLADDGVAHVEVPSLRRLVEGCTFDTIYHEHHCYFSAIALRALFAEHGLVVKDVEEIEIHGGSLHLQVAREGDESAIDAMCDAERAAGLHRDAWYADFTERVHAARDELHRTLKDHRTVAAYGAAAKGIVLLNAFGLDRRRIPWVADVSPHKQGRFVPGTRQEVVPPERLLEERPDACLLLPWNLREEIVARQAEYLERGGVFVVPLPTVERVEHGLLASLAVRGT
jgi:SAM-dependent methyltransferase